VLYIRNIKMDKVQERRRVIHTQLLSSWSATESQYWCNFEVRNCSKCPPRPALVDAEDGIHYPI